MDAHTQLERLVESYEEEIKNLQTKIDIYLNREGNYPTVVSQYQSERMRLETVVSDLKTILEQTK